MRRGRPPYPDLLTPREQEVLDLLRLGLTNQQIADRLGITLYGARYHVSEILSKLGVASREQAAAWQPEAASRRWAILGILHRLAESGWFKAGAAGAIGAAAVAVALLAFGVIAMGTRRANESASVLATPTPTVAPEATPTLSPDAPPVGPLIVALENYPEVHLLVYDVGASRLLVDKALTGGDNYTGDARAGEVLIASTSAVSAAAFDGTMRDIYSESRPDYKVANVAVSPDGSMAAIAVQLYPGPESLLTPTVDDGDYLLFLDLATGDEISRITKPTQPTPGSVFDGYNSRFKWLTWRDDGTGVVVSGETGSERPGGWATVYLDGRVVRFDQLGYPSVAPNGQLAADGENIAGCMSIGTDVLGIFELGSVMPDTSLTAPEGSVVTAWAWSPDSTQLLVAQSPLAESDDSQLCPDFRQQTYRLLDIASGDSQPVDDLDALYRSWYAGGPLLSMDCSDGAMAYALYNRLGPRYVTCNDLPDPPHQLLLNGQPIADGNQFQILGIIQP